MTKTFTCLLFCFLMAFQLSAQVIITTVFDGPLSGGLPKGVELYVPAQIDNLSLLGIGSANNGGGTDSVEYSFPTTAVAEGAFLYVSADSAGFFDFFGFQADYVTDAMLINGDDAVELFWEGTVIDVFGDINVDGNGEAWEYLDGWASRIPGTGPDGAIFNLNNWNFSGPNALDGEDLNATAANPVPFLAYTGSLPDPDYTVELSGLTFSPDLLVVDHGDIVQWDNIMGTHNVNGSKASYPDNTEDFYSGDAEAAPWSFQHTFVNPGYNQYHCDPHVGLGMTGAIMVREQGDHYVKVENNFFTPADITIELGETVVWTNVSGNHNVNGSSATYPDNPQGFSSGDAGENWTWSFTFNQEGVYDYQCDPHLGLGMIGTVTVASPYQVSDIATVTQIDADGVGIYVDSLVEITAIVYGQNLRPSGLQFTMIDGTNDGIGVFLGSDNLGYTVAEGDMITMRGEVQQFNGLLQMNPHSIELVSALNPLVNPLVVTQPSEATESSLIKIEGLSLIDPAQWPASGSSGNVDATNGTDTVLIRIDSDMFIGDAPTQSFDLTGIGGQYDNSSPYWDGYQILPRYAADIEEISALAYLEDIGISNVYPNPVSDILNLESETDVQWLKIYDVTGKLITELQELGRTVHIDVTDYETGLYILHIKTDRGLGSETVIKL